MVVVLQRAALSEGASTAIKSCIAISARISALPRGFVAPANVTTIHYKRLKQNAWSFLFHNRKFFFYGISECKIESEKNTFKKFNEINSTIKRNLHASECSWVLQTRFISSFLFLMDAKINHFKRQQSFSRNYIFIII